MGIIERVVGPATNPIAAAKKVALGHVFLFPSYAFAFNVWMGLLEGRGVQGGITKFEDTWAEVFMMGSAFWPIANMFNFMYCPPAHRVLFLNGGGLFWNAYLSYQNVKSNERNSAPSRNTGALFVSNDELRGDVSRGGSGVKKHA